MLFYVAIPSHSEDKSTKKNTTSISMNVYSKNIITIVEEEMAAGNFANLFSLIDEAFNNGKIRKNPFLSSFYSIEKTLTTQLELLRIDPIINEIFSSKNKDNILKELNEIEVTEFLKNCINKALWEEHNYGAAIVYSNILLKIENNAGNQNMALMSIAQYRQNKNEKREIDPKKHFNYAFITYMAGDILENEITFLEDGKTGIFITKNEKGEHNKQIFTKFDAKVMYFETAESINSIDAAYFYLKAGAIKQFETTIYDYSIEKYKLKGIKDAVNYFKDMFGVINYESFHDSSHATNEISQMIYASLIISSDSTLPTEYREHCLGYAMDIYTRYLNDELIDPKDKDELKQELMKITYLLSIKINKLSEFSNPELDDTYIKEFEKLTR
ncbi:hypothetical protein KO317_02300 [Candidatus Micrarchaeota archaeon]|nr:hypothetical protein [Candidatus Micrarchaeota archaeon]